MVPVGVFGFLRTGAQRFFLLAANGPAVLGIYSLGATLCSAVAALAISPLHMVWTAKMYGVYEKADAGARLGTMATRFVFVHLFAALPLVLFAREVIGFLSADSYAGAEVVIIPLVLSGVIETFTNIPDQAFFVRHKTGYKAIISGIAATLAICVYAILIPAFGIYGAAYGLAASSVIRAALTIVISRRVFPIHFEVGRLIQLAALTFLVGALGLQCPSTAYGMLVKATLLLGWLLGAYAFAIVPRTDFAEFLRFAQSLVAGARRGFEKRLPRAESG
jgi:O-antigen/teichoic acid export membrane protein